MSELVVKDNALIQASYTLDLAEQRLILLAIIEARNSGQGITHDSLLRIHASNYAKQFGVNDKTAYTVVKDASKGLFDRYVTYHDKNPKNGKDRSFHCRWVDKIGVEPDSGIVYMRFTSDVVPLITRLESHFTSYEIAEVANLTSIYAIRLYELIIQWRDNGVTQRYKIDDLRQKLGVEPEQYKTMSNLKAKVLDRAINQINKHTDITVKYEQHKTGRTITAMSFTFKVKKAPEPIAKDDGFIKMTDSQVRTFSSKLARLPELGNNAPSTAGYDDFAKLIADDLKDADKQKKYHKHLAKLGFEVAKRKVK
ncbi:replication initiation protein RepM [Psychrobacter sp. 4Bb]|uniref:replication initiation protein RepM n=1 Tax=Psychrobacter sp. 4Bb TaxID=888436 RepID=UPI000C7E7C8C|nr:replication initiation protein RepM [Psychrobacter sp. 4Bb]PKH84813.1 RepB family plasmid replication initiator protein [Psychrobacter sp. 4Bb]